MTGRGPTVAGVDGCRGRWMVVTWTHGARGGIEAELLDDLAPLFQQVREGRVAAVAIDIPIGLLEDRPRRCDVEARRFLGPRRASVFPAPVRSTLGATDHATANERSRRTSGRGLSIQAFNLIPAITHVDRLITPADQDRIVEAHPECAFTRLTGEPPAASKRTADGRRDRIARLSDHHPALAELLTEPQAGLPIIDLIDAAANAVTAGRVVDGTANRFGSDRDATGLTAEIVY